MTKYVEVNGQRLNPFRISRVYMTFRFDADDQKRGGKCGGCNWPVMYLYVMATSLEQARELLEKDETGLCGNCYSNMLAGYSS